MAKAKARNDWEKIFKDPGSEHRSAPFWSWNDRLDPDEVRRIHGLETAPSGVDVFNPAFDVTPHRYITAFVTERGVIRPPFGEALKGLSGR